MWSNIFWYMWSGPMFKSGINEVRDIGDVLSKTET